MAGRDIRLSKDRINCGGGNYGELEVLDNIVRFSSENRCSTVVCSRFRGVFIVLQQYAIYRKLYHTSYAGIKPCRAFYEQAEARYSVQRDTIVQQYEDKKSLTPRNHFPLRREKPRHEVIRKFLFKKNRALHIQTKAPYLNVISGPVTLAPGQYD